MSEKLKVCDRIVRSKGIEATATHGECATVSEEFYELSVGALNYSTDCSAKALTYLRAEKSGGRAWEQGGCIDGGRTNGRRRVATKWPRFHSWKTSIASLPLRYGAFPRNNSTEVRAPLPRKHRNWIHFVSKLSLPLGKRTREGTYNALYIHFLLLIILQSNVRTLLFIHFIRLRVRSLSRARI